MHARKSLLADTVATILPVYKRRAGDVVTVIDWFDRIIGESVFDSESRIAHAYRRRARTTLNKPDDVLLVLTRQGYRLAVHRSELMEVVQ